MAIDALACGAEAIFRARSEAGLCSPLRCRIREIAMSGRSGRDMGVLRLQGVSGATIGSR